MRTRVQIGIVASAALIALTGCSAEPTAPATTVDATTSAPGSSPTPTPDVGATPLPPTPTATPIPTDVVEEHGGPVETFTEPTWDDASRTAALDAAVTAAEAFARPDVPYEQWWAELAPLMSAQAQVDYQYVDPANIPARAVTGAAVLVDETSASIAGVDVPTDVGTYTVTLSRGDAAGPWLVERIAPPEGLG